VKKPVNEEFEAYWNFVNSPALLACDTIHHAAADCRLTHFHVFGPLRAIREQIVDADREIVIGRQQSTGPGYDAMTVVVRVASDSEVEFVLQGD
jgi:hypothetical protein